MSWKHTVDIKQAWEQAENGEITTAQLAGVLAEQLHACPIVDAVIHAAEFETLAKEPELSDDKFDAAFSNLYDWADDNRVWIATTF